jgi:hypothetical protein
MKKMLIFLVVCAFLAMNASGAMAWKEKFDDDFTLGGTGATVKVGSIVSGGYFFQPPNAVNFVAATQPAREEVAQTTSVTTTKYNFREGKCPEPNQTRSVGWGGNSTTTTTTTVTKTPAKAEVVHASSHMGRAPLETILPAIAGIGQSAVGGYFFKEGMRVLRPDNFSVNQSQTGGTQVGGGATVGVGVNASGGTGYGGSGGAGGTGGSSSSKSKAYGGDAKATSSSDASAKASSKSSSDSNAEIKNGGGGHHGGGCD